MHLFSPLLLGQARSPNRIVLNALPSGQAGVDGTANDALIAWYDARARGGVGTIILEAAWPLRPQHAGTPHLGLYDDAFIPGLSACVERLHRSGSCVIVMIDQPLHTLPMAEAELRGLRAAWVAAASRAYAARADGMMLSCADSGPFHELISPLTNTRTDTYGGSLENRTRLLLEVTERLHTRFGARAFISLKLLVEEFTPGGVTLQDARVIARRLTGAGVRLIEAYAVAEGATHVAHFPGWQVPLAASLRTIADVPVLVGGLSDDPELADSIIRDHSADMVALGDVLCDEPDWPMRARLALRET